MNADAPETGPETGFAELVAATNYSFLRGASHPAEMVARAIDLGMTGIGIADRNSVAGVVRAWAYLKEQRVRNPGRVAGFRLVVGARLVFADGTPDIVAYPVDRHGWGRLTRLLSTGNLRAEKGGCILGLGDLLDHCEGLLLIAMDGDAALLRTLKRARPKSVWLAATMPQSGDDARRLAGLQRLSAAANTPLLATNDALYATAAQRPLHDIITCIREGVTIPKAGKLLRANAERHLKSPSEMKRLFAQDPRAIDASAKLLSRIRFDLEDLRYEYPHEPVPPGWKPFNYLHHLVKTAAEKRYGLPLPPKVRALIGNELRLIRHRSYVYYFLTVYDLVRFARAQAPPILCQGRGSAANSIVCFLLGVTSVDPMQHDLLFSRFVSAERDEPPDIDVDFEHERREEVIQYIYDRYTRDRAAIAATVIHYRPRSTIREVGKALGLSEDVTARLADTSWGSWGDEVPVERLVEAGLNPHNGEVERLHRFVGELLTFPRHLSQHVGGFVLTEGRLDELVPIHNAAMEDRTFIEWDKDDIDALGLMKVDVLALGMLTCIRKCFDLMRAHGLGDRTLELDIDAKDPAVYDMLCRGDSIGVFQVESRAQINMLPRLRPREFYDLVVQVAIVRPGPIEGDMVHPYLRRRNGEEKIEFPSPAPPHDPNEL
ncbi:MAG: error-prone DNA polymerase, partial [Sphingopyxis sp.]|nr:error-prone DNA polymerase [Sphingopyxis sp.]